jgi:hypothetical protein
LGSKPLYILLLLTEKPTKWPRWSVGAGALALAAGIGLVWAREMGDPAWGWAVSLGLLAFALADWGLLAFLPWWGLSFGAVQPPFLAGTLVRGCLTLISMPLAVHWPWPTMIGLALIQVLLWVLMAYGTLIEPFRVQVTRVEIPTKASNPGSPLRIVQLADLHVERLTQREQALPALVAGLAPDLVVLSGDYLNTSYNNDPQAVADLCALLAQFHAAGGVYAIWGTAEVDLPDVLRPVLHELGIVLLEDEAIEVPVGAHHLWLMGLSCSRDLAADGSRLGALLAQAPPGTFTLLLYHTPDLMPEAAALGVDLYLAGHTHGGQWRLPGFGAILTSSHYWKRYEAGHYREGKTDLYVSRGLGMEGFGTPRARFFCPPEVVSVTLSAAERPTE